MFKKTFKPLRPVMHYSDKFIFACFAWSLISFGSLVGRAIAREQGEAEKTHILVVVGPSNHPPGTHEVGAGGKVMKHCLESSTNVSGISATIVEEWPMNREMLDATRTIVFIGDFFPPGRMQNPKWILGQLEEMTKRGCGIACVHYATGLHGDDVTATGEHPLLHWIGGYFANRSCPHHESFARIFERANIEKSSKDHPINRGWKPFTVHDEPYYNNYFGQDGNKHASNVTVLATSMLPPNQPKSEAVAWCAQRADGGRGFGIVMPHFYRNWANDDLRMLIMNGIVWTANREVPAVGVQSPSVDLSSFNPKSIEPIPRK